MNVPIGHNGGPSFDEIVSESKENLLLTMKEVIMEAVRDPRLDRRHLRVLAEVIDHINSSTGTSFPGHKAIAAALRRYNVEGYPDQGYSDQGIRNTLSELITFGYLVSTRRAGEKGGKALAHYGLRKPRKADLQDIITQYIMAQRMAPPRPHPIARSRRNSALDVTSPPDVIHPADVTSGPDVTSPHDIRSEDDIRSTSCGSAGSYDTKRSADVIHLPDVRRGPDVRSPVGTVTNSIDINKNTGAGAGAREGEEHHVGHGVFVNGETVRHAQFAISIPGVRQRTINTGMTANEIKQEIVGLALQLGLEFETGKRTKPIDSINQFVVSSIVREHNRRLADRAKGYQNQPSKASGPSSTDMTSPDAKCEHWLRNTEYGREMVRSKGWDGAKEFYFAKIGGADAGGAHA